MVAIPTVRDAISPHRLVLDPKQDLLEAISILVGRSVPGAPVVGEDGKLVGLLTVKDCLRIVSGSAYGEQVGGTVEHYMSPLKGVLEPEMDLFRAVQVFLQGNFPILPVLEGDRLLGCVSRTELLNHIHQLDLGIQREREREEADRAAWSRPGSIEQLQKIAAQYRE